MSAIDKKLGLPKSCPYCDSDELQAIKMGDGSAIVCMACSAIGPGGDDEKLAIEYWNARARDPDDIGKAAKTPNGTLQLAAVVRDLMYKVFANELGPVTSGIFIFAQTGLQPRLHHHAHNLVLSDVVAILERSRQSFIEAASRQAEKRTDGGIILPT